MFFKGIQLARVLCTYGCAMYANQCYTELTYLQQVEVTTGPHEQQRGIIQDMQQTKGCLCCCVQEEAFLF